MKNLTALCIILACGISIFLFTGSTQQEISGNESYVIVSYSTGSSWIYTYYGGTKREEVKTKSKLFEDSNEKNQIIDVLQSVSGKGYELVSSTAHDYNVSDRHYTEYNYTFRKRN